MDQFELVNVSSPFAFDQSSVMLYCSMCSSSSKSIPAMVFKDGTKFGTAQRLSTVDVLEVQVTFIFRESRGLIVNFSTIIVMQPTLKKN